MNDKVLPATRPKSRLRLTGLVALLVASNLFAYTFFGQPQLSHVPRDAEDVLARCRALNVAPGPPPDFYSRAESDRFEPGTSSVLIKNATIWTGRVNGLEVVRGSIAIQGGIITAVGIDTMLSGEYDIVDAKGAWVTPGIVDMHSHLGGTAPQLDGASDTNSFNGLVLPFLRVLDGLNTHDEGYALAVSGGVTTSLVLPGSADAMGGQGFPIKLRPTKERSSSSLLVEPPYGLNGSQVNYNVPPRWRHMKHACGENPARVYSGTRMDSVWAVRKAYDAARQLKLSQDRYCAKALAGKWEGLGDFSSDLSMEALVDVLRGKTKVQTHCYEAVDLDAFIRMSNEFQFPVAAFHHAHETYLVPEVLKRNYGGRPPASAVFSTFSRYKREAYRHSEFAPKILADNELPVVMKTDHPAIVSRYLMNEAATAHYYGLSARLALASVTSTPAQAIGLDHRIGFIKPGYDADLVIWDSNPLQLGATPIQTFIDGIPQLNAPFVSPKPAHLQTVPKTPNFDAEAELTLKHDGLPPLDPTMRTAGAVLFTNVSTFWTRAEGTITRKSLEPGGSVLFQNGVLTDSTFAPPDAIVVDLENGSLAPALVSAGSALGLQEIAGELTTLDGLVSDPLSAKVPSILGNDLVIQAIDGLQFGTRDALLAYRSGVSSAITAPSSNGVFQGLSVAFSLGSKHKLEKGAIIQDVAAVHVRVSPSFPSSVSTQIAALRKLLVGESSVNAAADHQHAFTQVKRGAIPLVVTVNSADIIASLLSLKAEAEKKHGISLKMTLMGATEAHLLADEIAASGTGIILTPPRSFPYSWEHLRILPGPPLTRQSSAAYLASRGVVVGLGPQGVGATPEMATWAVRNLRFDMAWVALESGGSISREEVLAMGSSNTQQLLGVDASRSADEFVVTKGGDLFSLEAKVVGMVSAQRGVLDLF